MELRELAATIFAMALFFAAGCAVGFYYAQKPTLDRECPKTQTRVTTRMVGTPTLILQDGIWTTMRRIETTENVP